MITPIIFFHKGNPDYLKLALEQALCGEFRNDVVLLGDETNEQMARSMAVRFYNYSSYKQEAQNELVKYYKHMSTNPAPYELICIARWFIINEFLEKENIDRCFVTDSDVLIYDNMSQAADDFEDYRCTLTRNTSAGISFINDRSVLREYCDLVLNCYTGKDPLNFDKAKSHFDLLQRNGLPGGVCDMTFWGILRNAGNAGDFGETMSIVDETTFDHNINMAYGYEHDGKIKKIQMIEGTPYCKHLRTGKLIRFKCLHFQGVGAKGLMKHYIT